MVEYIDMVHLDEEKTSCTVHDTMPCATQKKISLVVRPNYTVDNIFRDVSTQFQYNSFELILQSPIQEDSVFLNDKKDKILYDIPGFIAGTKNTLVLMETGSWENNPKKKVDLQTTLSPVTPDAVSDDDLALGASASPTESTSIIPIAPALPIFDNNNEPSSSSSNFKLRLYSSPRPALGYVGLVNQAMTCYLNSLLQALFMTPEFRNALYNWEFDGVGEGKSIPYQLQKLFLNLQTSPKAAVETTDLTRSFGWDSTEAWQQHDIQELCRVMFDALERTFKNTEQADLINRLYEGKMIDYVKCLECRIEKSREDTFLDIPLPVRPFGSNVAYGSIEEALRAFVQPETLEGNNQYFCEKCDKKCDAHKGLKFKKFPYILTLHLKRFDFDYQTLHRIKLNDKVTFPQTLNLNSFINATDAETFAALNNNHVHTNGFASSASSDHENVTKFDDCSTTDSGAALEEDNCSGTATTASSSHHENELQEDDEGIDLSASTDNKINSANDKGPYLYELFAIMIHSGSASGGHYYAYIKEFENDEWYCFNDQTVSTITQEDIQKSFGGGSFKSYYSGVYSSSTNAYMLMYRQIDPKLNKKAIRNNEFPEHITKLLQRLHDRDQEEKRIKDREPDIIKPRVYFYNPILRQFKDVRVYISKCYTLETALETAHGLLNVQNFAPISRCRLVSYDHANNDIDRSFEGREKETVGEILDSLHTDAEFLLETKGENEEFEIYEPGAITYKVFKVDLKKGEIDGPFFVRAQESTPLEKLRKLLGRKLKIKLKDLVVAIGTTSCGIVPLRDGEKIARIYAACDKNLTDKSIDNLMKITQEKFSSLCYMYVRMPNTDKEKLDTMAIPPYIPKSISEQNLQTPKQSPLENKHHECGDVVDAVMLNGTSGASQSNHLIGPSGDCKRYSPIPPVIVSSAIESSTNSYGGESNSEDSSLSDGDRTLVENHDSSRVSSTTHSPQLSSPDDDNVEKLGCRQMPPQTDEIQTDDEEDYVLDNGLYFRAIQIKEEDYSSHKILNGYNSDSEDKDKDSKKVLKDRVFKILADKRMKMRSLKRHLEPHLGVASEYFKIIRRQSDQIKNEWTNMSESLIIIKEGEQISIELGRNLKKGEHKAKIHFLKLGDLSNETGKLPIVCEWIFKIGMPVTDAKRELIAHLQKIDTKYENLTLENCRLWEKSGRNPVRILSDDQRLGNENRLSTNCEMVIQECENGVNTNTSEESLTLFVRRWHPSTLELDQFQEITLDKNTDIKKVLSTISDIPIDKIAYSKVNSSFPCTNVSLLNINSSMSWFTNSATTDNDPLYLSQNACVYFYKNSNELPKDLTSEERRELNQKEKARLERIGGTLTTTYSPRRERALKIYLEKY